MRKWTYLVAALLMSGATATFTSCIDTDEPAGIEELRGAKAELLRAKAAVEQAEAAIRTAQAAWVQAKADYEAQKAAQEELKTQIQQAKTEAEVAGYQQKMQENAEAFEAKMYQLQAQTERQRLAYEQALAEVEVALITMKGDMFATELNNLMFQNVFQWDRVSYFDTDGDGIIDDVTTTPNGGRANGLKGLADELATLKDELADLMRDQALLEFSYDPEILKTGVAQKIAELEGEIEGYEKTVAELQNFAGMTIDEFETKFNEVKDKLDDIDDQIAQLALDKVNDADWQAIQTDQERLDQDKNATSAFTFTIPEAVQDDVFWMLNDWQIDINYANSNSNGYYSPYTRYEQMINEIRNAAVYDDEEGEYTFPNGFRLSATTENQANLLNLLVKALEEGYSWTDNVGTPPPTTTQVEKKVLTAEELAVKDNELTTHQSNYDGLVAKLTPAEETWQEAYDAYMVAYGPGPEGGNYVNTEGEDARSLIIDAYNDCMDKITEAAGEEDEDDLVADAKKDFIALYEDYLAERTKLDGLELAEAVDIIDDDANWDAWVMLDENDKFGVADLKTATKGLAGALWKAADEVGYSKSRQTLITYAEWKEGSVDGLVPNGLTDKAYSAQKTLEDTKDAIANAGTWATFAEALNTQLDGLNTTLAAFAQRQANIDAREADVNAKYDAQEAALEVQKAGMEDILDAMAAIMPNKGDADGNYAVSGTPDRNDFDTLLDNLESLIASYTGVDVTATPPTSGTSGSSVNVDPNHGKIAESQREKAMYEALAAALADGSYVPEQESLVALIAAQIEGKTAEIEVVQALFDKATAQKDALLAALTGGSAETPAE